MNYKIKRVVQTPIKELWDDKGPLPLAKGKYLSKEEIREMLRCSAVQFVVVNVGDRLQWIPVDECYSFWESSVQANIPDDPDDGVSLNDYPNGYVFFAAQWNGESDLPVIVLEMHH